MPEKKVVLENGDAFRCVGTDREWGCRVDCRREGEMAKWSDGAALMQVPAGPKPPAEVGLGVALLGAMEMER